MFWKTISVDKIFNTLIFRLLKIFLGNYAINIRKYYLQNQTFQL